MRTVVKGGDALARRLMESGRRLSKEMHGFGSWAIERGLEMRAALEFENYNSEGMGYGLKCGEPVSKQQLCIFRCPVDSAITAEDDRMFDQEQMQEVRKRATATATTTNAPNPQHIMDLLVLTHKLICLLRTPESPYKAYVQTLPRKNLPNLGCWQIPVLSEINSTLLIDHIKEGNKAITYLYSSVYDSRKPLALRDEFELAFELARSRHAVIPGRMMLCPFIDYLNHSFQPNCVLVEDINAGYVEVQSLREIAAGEQLLVDYGHIPNLALAQKYGFAVERNPHSEITMKLDSPVHNQYMREGTLTKHEIARDKLGTGNLATHTLRLNELDPLLMAKVRLLMIVEPELLRLCLEGSANSLMGPLSKDNEALAKHCIRSILELKLSHTSKIDYGQLKQERRRFRNIHEFNLYTAAVLEEEERSIIVSTLRLLKQPT